MCKLIICTFCFLGKKIKKTVFLLNGKAVMYLNMVYEPEHIQALWRLVQFQIYAISKALKKNKKNPLVLQISKMMIM